MEVGQLVTLSSLPKCGALLGTSGGQEIFDALNARNSGSGIMFGSENDPFADQYNQFTTQFVDVARTTLYELEEASAVVSAPTTYVELSTEEDLRTVPPSMYAPLLTYKPIRDMFQSDQIAGWGVDKDLVPDNDPYENSLKWGLIESDMHGDWPEYVTWSWDSEDLDIPYEHRDKVLHSRRYLAMFIADQLRGDLKDPTDIDNDGLIGDII